MDVRDEAAERLAIRIHDALATESLINIANVGAMMFGPQDRDVKIIRGQRVTDQPTETVPHDPALIKKILDTVSDQVKRSLSIKFMPAEEAPVDLTGAVCLVCETLGGIFAYINDPATAVLVYETMNEQDLAPQWINETRYSGLDFDPEDHQADFMKSVRKGEVFRLMNGLNPIGYVLHNTLNKTNLLNVILT